MHASAFFFIFVGQNVKNVNKCEKKCQKNECFLICPRQKTAARFIVPEYYDSIFVLSEKVTQMRAAIYGVTLTNIDLPLSATAFWIRFLVHKPAARICVTCPHHKIHGDNNACYHTQQQLSRYLHNITRILSSCHICQIATKIFGLK
jgi:hypothetical protein